MAVPEEPNAASNQRWSRCCPEQRPSLPQICHCLFSFTPFSSPVKISTGAAACTRPYHPHPHPQHASLTCLAPCTTTYSWAPIGWRPPRAKRPWALMAESAGAPGSAAVAPIIQPKEAVEAGPSSSCLRWPSACLPAQIYSRGGERLLDLPLLFAVETQRAVSNTQVL